MRASVGGTRAFSAVMHPGHEDVRSYISVLLLICLLLFIVGLISSDSSDAGDIVGFFSILCITTIVLATMHCNSQGITGGIQSQRISQSNIGIRALWIAFIGAIPIGLMLISMIISENGSALLMLGISLFVFTIMASLLLCIKRVTDSDSISPYTTPADQYPDDVYADGGVDPSDGTVSADPIGVTTDVGYASSIAKYGDDSDSEL